MNRDADTYLTEAEIQRLTGKTKATAQRARLRTLGYPFLPDGEGQPVVLRGATPRMGKTDRDGLLEEGEIVRRAKHIQKISGVYFLVCGGRVNYVGKSTHIHERIAKHLRDRDIHFDAFYYVRLSGAKMTASELAYIKALRPWHNTKGVPR